MPPGVGPRIGQGAAAEVFEYGPGRVLRLYRRTGEAVTRAAEREAEAIRRANRAGVPVARAHELATVDGRPGIVLDRIDGADLLTLIGRTPWRFPQFARMTARLHASLHASTVERDPTDRSTRQHLESLIVSSDRVPGEHVAAALDVLATLPDGDYLCHGDFHPGNVILSSNGPVVIDWEGRRSARRSRMSRGRASCCRSASPLREPRHCSWP